MQTWLWLAFFASFAVKMPMWPVHTWLPDAHVQAPTAGSVILAGILLKLGGYGFVRFSLPMFPLASDYFAPFVFALSVVAIIYTSLVAMMQTDIKKLIAYSSVAHMGYVTMGIFAANTQGVQGAIFQMLSHGIVSGALFLCVGVVYDRTAHPRDHAPMAASSTTCRNTPSPSWSSPWPMSAFPAHQASSAKSLTLLGVFRVNTWVAFFATSGVILSACLRALALPPRDLRRAGKGKPEGAARSLRLARRRSSIRWSMLTIFFGVYPAPVFDATAASVDLLVNNYTAAVQAAQDVALSAK